MVFLTSFYSEYVYKVLRNPLSMKIPESELVHPYAIDMTRVFIGDTEVVPGVPDYFVEHDLGSVRETHVVHLLRKGQLEPYFRRPLEVGEEGRRRDMERADERFLDPVYSRTRAAARTALESLTYTGEGKNRVHFGDLFRLGTLSRKVKGDQGLDALSHDVALVYGVIDSLDVGILSRDRPRNPREISLEHKVEVKGLIPESGKNEIFHASYTMPANHFDRLLRGLEVDSVGEYMRSRQRAEVACLLERVNGKYGPDWRLSAFCLDESPVKSLIATVNSARGN